MGHANVCMEVAAIANLVLDRDRNAVTNIPTELRAGRRIRPLIKVCCLQHTLLKPETPTAEALPSPAFIREG